MMKVLIILSKAIEVDATGEITNINMQVDQWIQEHEIKTEGWNVHFISGNDHVNYLTDSEVSEMIKKGHW